MGTLVDRHTWVLRLKYHVVATMIRGSLAAGDRADAFVLAIVLILFAMVTFH